MAPHDTITEHAHRPCAGAEMAETTFRIARMDCAADEQLVRMRLQSLEGVDGMAIDPARRAVTVRGSADPAAVARALEGLGLGSTQLDDADAVPPDAGARHRQRRALALALAINAALFVGELAAGLVAQSMGLIADSLDMLADASVYALSLIAVGRAARRRRQLAAASGYLQLGLACAGLLEVTRRVLTDEPLPDARVMVAVSAVALAGNVATLLLLRGARSEEAHFQASWIFTANDIKANAIVIAAAVIVAVTDSPAPDLLAGALIFVIVARGALRILRISR
jgi:Co/Zn/Cd efflux system component